MGKAYKNNRIHKIFFKPYLVRRNNRPSTEVLEKKFDHKSVVL